ncbi:hypothetical protein K488DRAFT_85251 [Vararia minispora EC-137]|uniref:Uncharacterized protein n=1 Tax=Vararia minispora EC-137 TaxID=1314806 RepID=A0ACB8QP05_9AGAM|nr:hypothetical protein K488DRAFT_85251 [Vararia minispora EC-137]
MPGSFFPRSPSLEPDSSGFGHLAQLACSIDDSDGEPVASTSRVEYRLPITGSPSVSRPSTPSTPSRTPRRPSGRIVSEATQRFHADADSSILLPIHPHSPNHMRIISADRKGKGRALPDADDDIERDFPAVHHTSSADERRVHGAEQALSAVRREHREKERRWENQADTTIIREERDDYLDRIKQLEEEVRRLKEELSKRPTQPVLTHASVSMPPPPPPPPPLNFRPRAPASSDPASLFASVRANLKHPGTPVEAPINDRAPRTKRKGQPTVNLASDKMAAFLTEMKTVRLRKVADAPPDFAASRELSSSIAGTKRKRDGGEGDSESIRALKRRLTELAPPPPPKVLDLDPFSRSFSGFPTQPVAGPSRLRASLLMPHAPGAGSIDGTDVTPSLASDDVEGESVSQEAHDESPRTPPPVTPATPEPKVAGTSKVTGADPIVLDVSDEEQEEAHLPPVSVKKGRSTPYPRRSYAPPISPGPDSSPAQPALPATTTPPSSPPAVTEELDIFAVRTRNSPLQPTPRKARPPGRLPRRVPVAPRDEEDGDGDVLNISLPPPLRPRVSEIHPRAHVPEAHQPSPARSSSPLPTSAPLLLAPVVDLRELRERSKTARSLIPRRVYSVGRLRAEGGAAPESTRARQRTLSEEQGWKSTGSIGVSCKTSQGQAGHKPAQARPAHAQANAKAAPSKLTRRRTLDQELFDAGGNLRESDASDREPSILEASGECSARRGFLAHGGGGGIPVFMGVGYVEGAEE